MARKKTIQLQEEIVDISKLKDHPRNYQEHPDDQIEHIIKSIEENGIYRNIVVAKDYTILAGHGVTQACRKMGIKEVPIKRLNLDPNDPKALKVIAGDNEINHLAVIDDRILTDMLKEIFDYDEENGLLGTGYDEMMLANLIMITRPASEIRDFSEAAHWVGMPEYEEEKQPWKVVINFRNMADRDRFGELIEQTFTENRSVSTWWPPKARDDLMSVKFLDESEVEDE